MDKIAEDARTRKPFLGYLILWKFWTSLGYFGLFLDIFRI